MKKLLLASIAVGTLAPSVFASDRDITTRDEFWRIFTNAQKYAAVQTNEGYYHNWKGEGFRARTWNVDTSRDYSDLCLDDSSTERTCYDSDGKKWKMRYGTNNIYPNEWSPDAFEREHFVGEKAPDLFVK
jgi:hypothetical protein